MLVAVAVAVLLASTVASVVTEVFWFNQLGYGRVYLTQLALRAGLFVVVGLLMAAAVVTSMLLAYRSRPLYAPVPGAAANLDRYREGLEPLRRVLTVVLPLLLGLFAGSAASGRWQTVLLWWNRQDFGQADPVFGHDIGFYVFSLPFLRLVVGLLTAVVLLAGLAGAATHYLYGGLRLTGPGPRTTTAARVQLAIIAAVLVALQAGSYWLDRYATLTNSHERFDGASFTDVTVVVPARSILALAALICAVLFIVTAVRGGWRFPAAGVALLVVTAVVAGGIVPALVQRVRVTPNEARVEAPYIQDNIEATRTAFGLADTQVTDYNPETEAAAGALNEDADTTTSIRLLDPAVVSPTFAQNQLVRNFYQFPNPLDVDRYQIDGQSQDVVVALRELNINGINNQSWVNTRTQYTHGYGLVAAAGNQQGRTGLPAYLEGGIPSSGSLTDALGPYEPRVYFGEDSPEYSVVGAPEGAPQQEIDYPTGEGEERTTFSGEGGPSVGNYFQRLLYAIKFRDANILLSSAVNPESQILYDRTPRERVQKVAPYLTLDGDPYPTIVDDRIKWVVDGYTTSEEYPYSQPQVLEDVTSDTLTTATGTVTALPPDRVNYLRNSVKATVDAYDGKVDLYAWDDADPVLAAWRSAFPGTVKTMAEMPAELVSHVRYPEDLFKVQRTVLASYHVTDPGSFYSQNDFWRVPPDPTTSAATATTATPAPAASTEGPAQPPYYLTLRMPEQDEATFSLSSTYIPRSATGQSGRNILTGFLAVDADAGDTPGQKREGYGTLRLLQLPTQGTVEGPGQVQAEFNSNTEISQDLNLLRQGGSRVINGNLLTLPVGDGLLYVQPVYVQSTGETAYPVLRRVIASFGDEIGFADTLDEALDEVFAGNSGVEAGDAGQGSGDAPVPGQQPTDGATPSPTQSPSTAPTDGSTATPLPEDVRSALDAAVQAEQEAQAALQQGDFAAYGEAQERLRQALSAAVAADAAASASATPSASPSATG